MTARRKRLLEILGWLTLILIARLGVLHHYASLS